MENEKNNKSCELCKVNFKSDNDRKCHYNGKKHIKMATNHKNFTCGLFVTGFGTVTSKDELLHYFSQFGPITGAHMGPKLNYMILVFENEQDAVTVNNKTHTFDGKKLIVEKRNPSTKVEMAGPEDPLDACSIKILKSLQGIPKLNEQMNMFLELMTPDIERIIPVYHKVNTDILNAMKSEFTQCEVYPFGSTTTFLQLNTSDIDIFVNIEHRPKDDIDCLRGAKKALHRSRIFGNIIGIPFAKVPIIKCVHKETYIKCDISFSNMLGVRNSQLIHYYLSMDCRLRPIMLAIKYWAKVQGLTGKPHLFSNYAMVMLFLFYLQRNYSFPSVFFLQRNTVPTDPQFIWNANFLPTDYTVHLDKLKNASHLSILKGFFTFYSDFPYASHIICPYLGEALDKSTFKRFESIPQEFSLYKMNIEDIGIFKSGWPICLQDPFIHNFNTCGAIFQNTVENFVILCKFANENIFSGNNEKNMLYLLFTQRLDERLLQTSAPDPENYLVCIRMKNQPNRLRSRVKLPENNVNFKKEVLNLWFEEVHSYVYTVLKEVFKFDLKEVDNSTGNNSKNSRRNNQKDVYDFEECKKYKAKCFFNMWDARNLNTSKIDDELEKCETTLAKNIMLSEYLWKEHVDVITSSPLFECEISFNCLDQPAMVNIELIRIRSYKKVYKSFCKYLLIKLPQWFDLNETELNK